MTIQNFDINQFTITMVGTTVNHVITGLAKDTCFSLAMDEEYSKYDSDNNGNVVTFNNYNRAGKVTITLHQASPSNDVLSRLKLQKDVTGVNGVFAFMAKDNNGSTLITSPGATVLGANNVDFGDSVSNRVWTILLTKVTAFIGGINV